MKFLERGLQYNKMAKALGNAFVAITNYQFRFNSGFNNDYNQFKQDLTLLAYLCRRDIIERIEEFGWEMGSPISIPVISSGKTTLIYAYQQTIERLIEFAEQINIGNEIESILKKKEIYDVMKRLTPNDMNFQSAMIAKVLMRYRYKMLVYAFLKGDGIIENETDKSVLICSRKRITKLNKRSDGLSVVINEYDLLKGWREKEWHFSNDDEEIEILKAIIMGNTKT